jgi:predicted DsbA family dithiol-disulfide isomerase
VHTEHAARAFQWLSDRNPDEARAFAHGVFRAYFVEGRNIAEPAVLLEIAAPSGSTARRSRTPSPTSPPRPA